MKRGRGKYAGEKSEAIEQGGKGKRRMRSRINRQNNKMRNKKREEERKEKKMKRRKGAWKQKRRGG